MVGMVGKDRVSCFSIPFGNLAKTVMFSWNWLRFWCKLIISAIYMPRTTPNVFEKRYNRNHKKPKQSIESAKVVRLEVLMPIVETNRTILEAKVNTLELFSLPP